MKPYPFAELNHFTVPVAIGSFSKHGRPASAGPGRSKLGMRSSAASREKPGQDVRPRIDGLAYSAAVTNAMSQAAFELCERLRALSDRLEMGRVSNGGTREGASGRPTYALNRSRRAAGPLGVSRSWAYNKARAVSSPLKPPRGGPSAAFRAVGLPSRFSVFSYAFFCFGFLISRWLRFGPLTLAKGPFDESRSAAWPSDTRTGSRLSCVVTRS